ncbi:MAG TPA: hypothetical protein VGN17_05090 [Bryobacteraceae bacterium]
MNCSINDPAMEDLSFPMYGESWWNVLSAFNALPAQFGARTAGGGWKPEGSGFVTVAIR